jgi:hypothetical protein
MKSQPKQSPTELLEYDKCCSHGVNLPVFITYEIIARAGMMEKEF